MRILVTGATGFVGKNLLQKLNQWHDVHILIRPKSNWSELGVHHVFEFSDNIEQLSTYLTENQIDGIIHLASLYIAEHHTNQIKDLIESNVYLGTALLEACKIAGTEWFLNTGSIWQNYNVPDFSEEYNPVNLYAASKQAFLSIAKYYIETSNIRFCTLKLCDTYGTNDTRRKVLSLFYQISRTGEKLQMSPGNQKLDILHIDDVVEGFVTLINILASNKNICEEYVLSSGKHISLKNLANIFSEVTNHKLNIEWGGRPYRIREVMQPWKGNVVPGWVPTINLEDGIRALYSK